MKIDSTMRDRMFIILTELTGEKWTGDERSRRLGERIFYHDGLFHAKKGEEAFLREAYTQVQDPSRDWDGLHYTLMTGTPGFVPQKFFRKDGGFNIGHPEVAHRGFVHERGGELVLTDEGERVLHLYHSARPADAVAAH